MRRRLLLLMFAVGLFPAVGSAAPLLAPNGHYYEFIGVDVTWEQALAAAAASNHQGTQGYLATVTSLSEQTFIEGLLGSVVAGGQVWLGGNDVAVEGEWRWVTGPEAGTQFWQGNASGSPVNGAFEAWGLSQPDNTVWSLAGPGEDFLSIERSGGLLGWNDAASPPPFGFFAQGYIVEYGDSIPVPEPGLLTLLGLSLGALAVRSRARKRGA